MKRIAVSNFRKFKEYTSIEISPITFFVGENNAGKSTIVKAILLIYDFFQFKKPFGYETKNKIDYNTSFFFNSNKLAHVGSSERALSFNSENDKILFEIDILEYTLSVHVAIFAFVNNS